MSTTIPLEPGKYYHIYNRGNNRENLFVQERNYACFLKLYAHYVAPVAATYAYCLLKNHFHLLVRINDLSDLADLAGPKQPVPSRPFSHLFNAYTKAFNRVYQRSGVLFQRPFQRIEVTSDAYFVRLITYIHHNPQKHGFVADFRDWPYSSYHALLSARPTQLQRDDVLAWFNGPDEFAATHLREVAERDVTALVPEDFD